MIFSGVSKLYSLIKEQDTKAFEEISSKMYGYFYDEIWKKNSWKSTQSLKNSETLWDENNKAMSTILKTTTYVYFHK